MPAPEDTQILRFDAFELDERTWELRRAGERVDIQHKPLLLLHYLLRNHGRVVPRDELFQRVWHDLAVSDGSLTTAIYEMRRAIGDLDGSTRLIATIRGLGYRFVGQVQGGAAQMPVLREPAALTLVGREAESARVDAALARVEQGERRILLLHGPPGIGKTALAMDIARRARARGHAAYVARAFEGAGAPALWTWIQIVRSLMETCGPEALHALYAAPRTQLMRRTPELSGRAGLAPGRAAFDDGQSFELFDSMATLIAIGSRSRPTVLILDDLHAADAASLAFLRFLAHDLQQERLFIVGAHREPLAAGAHATQTQLRELAAEPFAERMELGCLGSSATRQILSAALGSVPSPELTRDVQQASGGVPFFVASVAAALARSPQPASARPAQVLAGMRDALRVRVASCSPTCQKLLRTLSVRTCAWPPSLLREVLGLDAEQLSDAREQAKGAGLLRQRQMGEIELAHLVVREAIYADLAALERRDLHRRLAQVLERRPGLAEPAEVALHWTHANNLS